MEDAKKFASETAAKVERSGLASLETDPDGRRELARLKAWGEQCSLVGHTLEEVFSFGLRHFEAENRKGQSPFVSELLTKWVDDKCTGFHKRLRERTLKDIRNAANRMKVAFGDLRIAQINRTLIEDYIKDGDVSRQTSKNRLAYASQFFNHSIPRYWKGENPTAEIESIHVEREMPKYYSIEQCRRILQESQKVEGLTPYVALCLFAGIRPEECQRMTWGNIRSGTAEIWLPRDITKTASGRQFKMADNLVAWLAAYRNRERLIPNRNMQNVIRKIKGNLGFGWVADGMRHTFATYHYATHHSIDQLRFTMGNSPGVIDNFYKGEISESHVTEFWNLYPDGGK